MKVYKSSIIKVIIEMIFGIIMGFVAMYIVSLFKVNDLIVYGVGIIVVLIVIYSCYNALKLKIITTKDTVIFNVSGKEERYIIENCSIRATTENNATTIEITQDGKTNYYDCSFLSGKNLDGLLEDLRIIGENQYIHKIETKKK